MGRASYVIAGLCVALITLLVSCDTENNIEPPFKNFFVKYYGGNGNQSAADMIVNPDGTMVLLGSWQVSATDSRIYIVKVSETGQILWERKYGTGSERARDIERTTSGFVVLMMYNSFVANTDCKVLLIDNNGNKLDSAIYGSPGKDNPKTITPLLDNGFLLTGTTEYDTTEILNQNSPDDLSDIFHYRCTGSLDFFSAGSWRTRPSGVGSLDSGTKGIQIANNVFYGFGTTNEWHVGNPARNRTLNYYAIDGGGELIKMGHVGDFNNNTESTFALPVPESLSGGVLFLGAEQSPSGEFSIRATRLRKQLRFDTVDDRIFDRLVQVSSRELTPVSAAAVEFGLQGFLVLANEIQSDGTTNIWLTKVDPTSGKPLWSASFGAEDENDAGAAVTELPDGKIVVLGTVSLVNNQTKMVMLKLNANGQLKE